MQFTPRTATARSHIEAVLATLLMIASGAIVAYKALVTTRININWDEFWYLSFVHALARGELTLVLQGAYTHLFAWLPLVATNEADQIVAARLIMVALLAVTAWLIWLLGRRWLHGLAAMVPPIVYLSIVPVAVHGGSFRADSMLAPLLMGALVLLARRPGAARNELLAGAMLGLAGAVTVKALLFAPLVAVLTAIMVRSSRNDAGQEGGSAIIGDLVRVGLAAGAVAFASVALHAWSLSGTPPVGPGSVPTESIGAFAARTASATILDSPLFGMAHLLPLYARWQPLPWTLITLGVFAAAHKRQWDMAALALALLPVAIYRNSFPYFYVVMLAPASVLAGASVQAIAEYLSGSKRGRWRAAFGIAISAGLIYQCVIPMARLWHDKQLIQREIIAGVHEIFPAPVNYIDRCGMVSSYRKVNFFMSSWGMQAYRSRGEAFMPEVLRSSQPAFVVTNSEALATGRQRPNGLLDADRELLERFYPRYWGPIRVAGAVARLTPGTPQQVELPFPEKYRVEAATPVLIDRHWRRSGDVIDVDRFVTAEIPATESGESGPLIVKFFLAKAAARPAEEPVYQPIFTGL